METKTLKSIQKISKIGLILSRIVRVFSVVGVFGCAIGLLALNFGMTDSIVIGGVTLNPFILGNTDTGIGNMYASMGVGLALSMGEMIVSSKAVSYFKQELSDGHPFTFEGAKKLKSLGISAIVIPIVFMIIAEVIYEVVNHYMTNVADMHIDSYESIGLGIAFLIGSLICRYGAEMKEAKTELTV